MLNICLDQAARWHVNFALFSIFWLDIEISFHQNLSLSNATFHLIWVPFYILVQFKGVWREEPGFYKALPIWAYSDLVLEFCYPPKSYNFQTIPSSDMSAFWVLDHRVMTALQITKASHSEYADIIALTTNNAHHLQLQLDKFLSYTTVKGLTLDAHKTKIMDFFCSNPPVICYNGIPLENDQKFRYLGDAQPQWEDDKCLEPDGMQFCWRHSQVWATNTLPFKFSTTTTGSCSVVALAEPTSITFAF